MAERRMFAKTIIDSDAFLEMPMSARLLYYDLGMRADDDGFVNSPKKIMKMCGNTEDDLKILIAKRFIIIFESGLIVIKHWRLNNYLRSDRYRETPYLDEKAQLQIDENGAYKTINEINQIGIPSGIPKLSTDFSSETDLSSNHATSGTGVPNGIPVVDAGKVRIGKDSIGKVSIDKDTVFGNYTENSDLISALNDFISMRKKIKSPMTDKAIELLLKNLDKLASDDQTKIDILNQSVLNGWKSIYPLKDKQGQRVPRGIQELMDIMGEGQ